MHTAPRLCNCVQRGLQRSLQRHPLAVRCTQDPGYDSDSSVGLRQGFLRPQKRAQHSGARPTGTGPTVIGAEQGTEATWRDMDKKSGACTLARSGCSLLVPAQPNSGHLSVGVLLQFNKYPGPRTFTAIGTGGAEFRQAMVKAVEDVVGPVSAGCVTETPSSKGSYVSVKVAVTVDSPDQVIQIFSKMKEDSRLKWCM